MKTLETIYWLRFVFGVVAASLCVGYFWATDSISMNLQTLDPTRLLLNSLSIAFATYLVSYYILRYRFGLLVENPRKLVMTGIGMYFFSWMVFWTLMYTIIAYVIF